jgi:hypothetical protein
LVETCWFRYGREEHSLYSTNGLFLKKKIFHHLLKLFWFFEESPVSALGEFDGLAVGQCGTEFIGDGFACVG